MPRDMNDPVFQECYRTLATALTQALAPENGPDETKYDIGTVMQCLCVYYGRMMAVTAPNASPDEVKEVYMPRAMALMQAAYEAELDLMRKHRDRSRN